jgi:LacI family transcriptional regulator
MPSVTIKDVARAAQVNASTVSKALRGLPGKVAPDTRRHIEKIAAELGYRHNAVAATLRTRRSNLIGVIVPDLANPLFGPILQGLETRLREAGWMSLIVQTPSEPAARRDIVLALATRQVAGLVITSAETDDPMLRVAQELGLPVVLVNRGQDEARFSSVVNDDRESVALVLAHLHALGHRHIAHLAGPLASSTGRARKDAFVACMKRLPGMRATVVDAPAFTRDAGFAATQALLRRRSARPTALFAGNDLMAVGAIDALDRAGLRVPEDMSVVGHNDMPLVDMIAPPLTTVRIPVEQMSQHAAQLLLEQLADPTLPPSRRMLTPLLVVRRSTQAVAVVPRGRRA